MKELVADNGMQIVHERTPLDVILTPRGVCDCGATIVGKMDACWKCNQPLEYIPDKRNLAIVKRILGNYRAGGDRLWL